MSSKAKGFGARPGGSDRLPGTGRHVPAVALSRPRVATCAGDHAAGIVGRRGLDEPQGARIQSIAEEVEDMGFLERSTWEGKVYSEG